MSSGMKTWRWLRSNNLSASLESRISASPCWKRKQQKANFLKVFLLSWCDYTVFTVGLCIASPFNLEFKDEDVWGNAFSWCWQHHCPKWCTWTHSLIHVACTTETLTFWISDERQCCNIINPLTPVPAVTAVTSLGLSSTSDVITFDQNWHHLYSTSAGGKDLSNDAQIRVISLMKPEICTKMLKKLSVKLRAKFPANTSACSMVKIACLRSFLTASKPSRRPITAAKRKEKEKNERQKKKNQKSKSLKP